MPKKKTTPDNMPKINDDLEFFSYIAMSNGRIPNHASGKMSNGGKERISTVPEIMARMILVYLNPCMEIEDR